MTLGIPAIINGINVDEYLLGNWPENFADYWIGIHKKGIFTTAYLIDSNENNQGAVVSLSSPPENYIAFVTWDFVYCWRALFTKEEYRNLGIGYTLGVWSANWAAFTYGKKLTRPLTGEIDESVERMLEEFEKTYQ